MAITPLDCIAPMYVSDKMNNDGNHSRHLARTFVFSNTGHKLFKFQHAHSELQLALRCITVCSDCGNIWSDAAQILRHQIGHCSDLSCHPTSQIENEVRISHMLLDKIL